MLQEKYNKFIYESGNEDTLRGYSHLRNNIFTVFEFKDTDRIALVGESAPVIHEYLEEQVQMVDDEVDTAWSYDYVFIFGKLTASPQMIKKQLKENGRVVFVSSEESISSEFIQELYMVNGYETVSKYYMKPDYYYATEIFTEEMNRDKTPSYMYVFTSKN